MANEKGKPAPRSELPRGASETLWDKYAMAALTGILANPEAELDIFDAAYKAAEFADTMVDVRAEPRPEKDEGPEEDEDDETTAE